MSLQLVQGAESNLSGKFLEDALEREFRARSLPVFDYDPDKHQGGDWVTPCFVVRNAPYTSIYGCNSRSEFLYRDCETLRDIRIECRWQQTPGSVDEKFPYLFMNAVEAMPEREVWFVIGGEGARGEAVDWLRRKCVQVAAKKLSVLTIAESRQAIKKLRG